MTLEFLVERWEDQRTIKNLMGKYVNCLLLNRQGEIFDSFFSTFNDGSYIGPDAVKGYLTRSSPGICCRRSCCKNVCPKSWAENPMRSCTASARSM